MACSNCIAGMSESPYSLSIEWKGAVEANHSLSVTLSNKTVF